MHLHAGTHTHKLEHRHTSPAVAASTLHYCVLFLPFMSQYMLDWIRSSLWGTRRSLLWQWHHNPTPWSVIYLHGGQRDSRGLPHCSTEVERPLKEKPHPSRQSILCTVLRQGILWENSDYFSLIIVGEDGRTSDGNVGWLNGWWMPAWVGVSSSDWG